MMSRLRLDPSAALTPTGVGVILRSDRGAFQVSGADAAALLDALVPLLDGSRDDEAVLTALPTYARGSVTSLLEALSSYGLVEVAPPADGAEPAARRRAQEDLSRELGPSARPPAAARVLVVGVAPWIEAAVTELAALGVGTIQRLDERAALDAGGASLAGGAFHLLLAAVPPGEGERLERIARFAHRARLASLWSHLGGTTATLGPLVTPAETACRVCAMETSLSPEVAAPDAVPSPSRARAMTHLLGDLLALEALRAATGCAPSQLGGRLVVQDLATLVTTRHTLVRLPWCRVCG